MKRIIFILLVLLNYSCSTSFVTSTFRNRNVYKTKANLKVKKAYSNKRPSTDQRLFTIVPNNFPFVNKTKVTVSKENILPVTIPPTSQIKTTTTITTIPYSSTIVTKETIPSDDSSTSLTSTTTTSYTVPKELDSINFIRYKVLSDDGDYKYIKVLTGTRFDGVTPSDTLIIYNSKNFKVDDLPENYVFQVSKKDLIPNTHYLASSALIGKIITLPFRVRNQYWDGDSKVIQGSLSLGYGFGWKYKLGNNPYQSHYLSTIFYAAGIGQQKYFSIVGTDLVTNKALLSVKTDEFAITYLSFGLAYEFEKFNIGIFAGKDKMFGNLKDWVYQDKWWWGLGIGYDLFK